MGAALVDGLCVLPAAHLLNISAHLYDREKVAPWQRCLDTTELEDNSLDAVIGQQQGKRALEIAACGGHHLLFLGRLEPANHARKLLTCNSTATI